MILTEKIVTCSTCKKKLKIPNKLSESARQVTCPVCKTPLFVNFYVEESPERGEMQTIYGPMTAEKPYIEYNGIKHYLEAQVTVIGRKAKTSTADIQIDTDDMYMGRHHAIITKRTGPSGFTTCSLRPKDAKNGLSVNDIELNSADEVDLFDGARIKMGNTVMVFHK